MKEPVDHILRPGLPWRQNAAITECGFDASNVKTVTRAEFFQRVKDLGQQRTAMLTCMTCSDTCRRWKTWEEDPRQALAREINWECNWRPERGGRLKDDLIAIAALIEAHADEFADIVATIAQRREWLGKKAASEAKKHRPNKA